MSDTEEDHDGQKTKAVFSTLVADGDWLYMKGEYKKALSSYTAVRCCTLATLATLLTWLSFAYRLGGGAFGEINIQNHIY